MTRPNSKPGFFAPSDAARAGERRAPAVISLIITRRSFRPFRSSRAAPAPSSPGPLRLPEPRRRWLAPPFPRFALLARQKKARRRSMRAFFFFTGCGMREPHPTRPGSTAFPTRCARSAPPSRAARRQGAHRARAACIALTSDKRSTPRGDSPACPPRWRCRRWDRPTHAPWPSRHPPRRRWRRAELSRPRRAWRSTER